MSPTDNEREVKPLGAFSNRTPSTAHGPVSAGVTTKNDSSKLIFYFRHRIKCAITFNVHALNQLLGTPKFILVVQSIFCFVKKLLKPSINDHVGVLKMSFLHMDRCLHCKPINWRQESHLWPWEEGILEVEIIYLFLTDWLQVHACGGDDDDDHDNYSSGGGDEDDTLRPMS